MGAIMGAWGQICEVYDWWCAHVPLLHWEHNYHGGHYRVCSHVITQLWGYSMALARWSNVTHGTRPQIHRAIGIFLGMVSTNFTHLWWNWAWLMIGFTTLEIISLKSHRTPKMFDDDDDHHHHHHHRKSVSSHLLGIPYVSLQKGWFSLTKLHDPLARGSISLYVASKVNRASTKPRKTGIF